MPSQRLLWPALALVTILFFAAPLFSTRVSIHWDLADVSYPAQKYFEQSVRAGNLPQWAPYLYSGIPFLSDPHTGAWYPLHWPFFWIGISPRALVWELALHAFLALGGAYLLARRLFDVPGPAVVGAVLYAWGGFFAAHTSNLAVFETAALLPWLLWAALGALDSGSIRSIALTAMIGGLIVLAGDPPAAIACFFALICVAISVGITARAPWKRTAAVILLTAISAVLLSAIQMLPAIELSKVVVHQDDGGAALRFRSLATLVAADYYGVISGLYSGPDDIRQHYLYSGLLLLPLAIAGFMRREKILFPLALILPALWYAFGRRAGLYALLSLIPGLRGSAPVDIWFVAALGLALAATSGAVWATERFGRPHLWLVLLVLIAADLWHWNMDKNPLTFARASFADLYGKTYPTVSGAHPRLWAPFVPVSMGPADQPLLSRTEVTYGTGLAELDRYADYMHAVESNPRLLNGLGVTHVLDAGSGKFVENPHALGRFSAPPRVQFVANRQAALAALATLDPAESAIVEAPARPLTGASVRPGQSENVFSYSSPGEALLRIAVPYYPGWSAAVDGHAAELVVVDEALTGVFVPAGEYTVTLSYHSQWLKLGAILSGAMAVILALSVILSSLSPRAGR